MPTTVLVIGADDKDIVIEAIKALDKKFEIEQVNVIAFNKLAHSTNALEFLVSEEDGDKKIKDIANQEAFILNYWQAKRVELDKILAVFLTEFDSEGVVKDTAFLTKQQLNLIVKVFEYYSHDYINEVRQKLYSYTTGARGIGVMSDVGEGYLKSKHIHDTAFNIRSALDSKARRANVVCNNILNYFRTRHDC